MAEVRAVERETARTSIVEATTRLLADNGRSAVTTRAVSAAAGIQAPTIYRLFGDMDGLLDAVAEHVMATYVATKEADDPRGDPVADLRAGWRRHVEFGLANPDLFTLLADPSRARTSRAVEAGLLVLQRRVRRLAEAGLLRVDEQRAVAMVHAAGTGAVLALLAMPPEQRDLGLADALFDALRAALVADAPAVPAPAVLGAAVALAAAAPTLPGLSAAEKALLGEWLDHAVTALRDG